MPSAALAAGGSISGTVTDAETLEPIQGVDVCTFSLDGGEVWDCAETDAAGEYELEGLAEGEYGVEFWAPYLGYATQFYDNETRWEQADPVVVGSEPVTGIDAALGPLAGDHGHGDEELRRETGRRSRSLRLAAQPESGRNLLGMRLHPGRRHLLHRARTGHLQ